MDASAADSLALQHFRVTPRRVLCLQFHSVLPIIAFADKDNVLKVWDYESDEVIHEVQLGAADEAVRMDLELQARAEKSLAFFGGCMADGGAPMVSKTPAGPIRSLLFCDAEVLQWEAVRQTAMRGASMDTAHPASVTAESLKGSRPLVVVCETKVVLMDLLRGTQEEVPRGMLESKYPTTAGAVRQQQQGSSAAAPFLCIGCADGAVRALKLNPMRLTGRLVGLKAAPTCMLTLCGVSASGGDKLIAGGSDGTLALWDPVGLAGGRDIPSQTLHKAHESSVLSMALLPPRLEQPVRSTAASLRLITLGGENRVAIWDLAPFRELHRAKPMAKVQLHSVVYTPHSHAGLGADPGIILSGVTPHVYGFRETGSVGKLCDLTAQLPNSSKKQTKVGVAMAHPTKPHLVALGTNVGMALLSFRDTATPPAVPLKGIADTPEASYEAALGRRSRTACYAVAYNSSLWMVACQPPLPREDAASAHAATAPTGLEVLKCQPMANLPHNTQAVLSSSSCGRVVAVCWPALGVYSLFRAKPGSESWEKICDGAAASVAWSQTGLSFAVVDAPVPQAPKMPAPQKGRRRGGGPDAAQMEAALTAARQAAAMAAKVVINEVSLASNSVESLEAGLEVSGKVPENVHGGALLGVTFQQSLSRMQGSGRAFQFYSWVTREATGEIFPEPRWVRWDSYAELCALGYQEEVIVCRCNPRMQRIASLAIAGVTSALWGTRQLFLAGPDSLDLAFVDRGSPPEEPYAGSPCSTLEMQPSALTPILQVVRLAGTALPPSCNLVSPKLQQPSRLQASQNLRPFGPLTILGMQGNNLWVVDTWGQPQMVDLSHPSIRMRIEAAEGNISSAKRTSARSIPAGASEASAAFMASMCDDGALQAMDLSGISIRAKLSLGIQAGQLSRAQRYLQALAAGATDPAHLKGLGGMAGSSSIHSSPQDTPQGTGTPYEGRTPRSSRTSLPQLSPSSRSEDGGDDLLGSAGKESPVPPSHDLLSSMGNGASAGSFGYQEAAGVPTTATGDIDWDAGIPSRPAAVLSSQPPSRAASDVAKHALRLVDEALDSGDYPAAAGCMNLLFKGAADLPSSSLLHAVHLRMVQCGMAEDANDLLSCHAAQAKSLVGACNRDIVLGAALTGEAAVVKQLLQGLTPEESLYNRAWGHTMELQGSLEEWNAELGATTGKTLEVCPY